uniref:Uncharacterized protein n=1 Tax=Panagrolaimus sp. JU765 TaxID=591449 RepID=A0AC34RKI8_9BILA
MAQKRYSVRRKTDEIILPVPESDLKSRRRKQLPRKNRFIRAVFDIDAFFGWEKENSSFEKMEKFFENQLISKQTTNGTFLEGKKRRVDPQKVWISQLTDIDKIYKASELRDIKMSAFG